MKTARVRVALLLGMVFAAPAAFAHHTVANSYDVTKIVSLKGVVTRVQWQNPHVVYHLSVAVPGGPAEDWEIESRHLQGMRDAGVAADTITVGDAVTMNVLAALDGTHRGATATITLADGRTVRVCTVTNNQCP